MSITSTFIHRPVATTLLTVGVKAGDTIKLRFDFGRDGCGGRDGWYVDNIKLQSCLARRPRARQSWQPMKSKKRSS